jgi:hypothetical protein
MLDEIGVQVIDPPVTVLKAGDHVAQADRVGLYRGCYHWVVLRIGLARLARAADGAHAKKRPRRPKPIGSRARYFHAGG